MNRLIDSIKFYSETEGIDILNTYRHYQNRRTTQEKQLLQHKHPQTNSFQTQTMLQTTKHLSSKRLHQGLVNNLSVEELKELMILLMDIDLDQTKSSNVFSVINAVKQQLMNKVSVHNKKLKVN